MDRAISRLLEGHHPTLSRLISLIEWRGEESRRIMSEIFPHTGKAYRIGITGPPGVGKSTLVSCLTSMVRNDGKSVGIIAIDPSSPYTGGAFLGDRVHMKAHYGDPGVFIRSMSTHGTSGGISDTVSDVTRLLDAAGKEVIIIESAGVGQTGVDIADVVDVVVLLLMPGAGDSIQSLKAGIMEIADIYAVNKCDLPGSDKTFSETRAILEMNTGSDWANPVILTQATNGIGIGDLYEAIKEYKSSEEGNSRLGERRQNQREKEMLNAINIGIDTRLNELISRNKRIESTINLVRSGKLEPYWAAMDVIDKYLFLQSDNNPFVGCDS